MCACIKCQPGASRDECLRHDWGPACASPCGSSLAKRRPRHGLAVRGTSRALAATFKAGSCIRASHPELATAVPRARQGSLTWHKVTALNGCRLLTHSRSWCLFVRQPAEHSAPSPPLPDPSDRAIWVLRLSLPQAGRDLNQIRGTELEMAQLAAIRAWRKAEAAASRPCRVLLLTPA